MEQSSDNYCVSTLTRTRTVTYRAVVCRKQRTFLLTVHARSLIAMYIHTDSVECIGRALGFVVKQPNNYGS